MVSDESIVVSQFLAKRRLRPSQAKVRSITQRSGKRWNPSASRGRLTIARRSWFWAAAQVATSALSPPSAKPHFRQPPERPAALPAKAPSKSHHARVAGNSHRQCCVAETREAAFARDSLCATDKGWHSRRRTYRQIVRAHWTSPSSAAARSVRIPQPSGRLHSCRGHAHIDGERYRSISWHLLMSSIMKSGQHTDIAQQIFGKALSVAFRTNASTKCNVAPVRRSAGAPAWCGRHRRRRRDRRAPGGWRPGNCRPSRRR